MSPLAVCATPPISPRYTSSGIVSGVVESAWPDGPVPNGERWFISEQILDVVVDERRVEVVAGALSFSMLKRRRER